MKKQDELNRELQDILESHDASKCPECGHEIGWGDVSWNSGDTGSGTPYSTVHIICVGCQTGIVRVDSWYPGIDDTEEVIYALADWE